MRLSLAETGQLELSRDEEAALRQVLRDAVQAQQTRLTELLQE